MLFFIKRGYLKNSVLEFFSFEKLKDYNSFCILEYYIKNKT
jgi:hypothetical protein